MTYCFLCSEFKTQVGHINLSTPKVAFQPCKVHTKSKGFEKVNFEGGSGNETNSYVDLHTTKCR